ncbi:carbohydrate ABC transporter permease [Georgenia sp. Z1344]|uniref:carbohydrate ABC transporter permease n=1 Tax=Georgenia sp. Z1344 TaxID=3416706 RepID=UPI003CF005A5
MSTNQPDTQLSAAGPPPETSPDDDAPRPARRRRPFSLGRGAAHALTYLLLLAGAVVTLAPLLLPLMTALKTNRQYVADGPLALPDPLTLENFRALFGEEGDFIVPLAVTLQMVVVLVVGQLVSSILAAYAFATLEFRGRELLFWCYLATLMVPAVVTIIPLYTMMTLADLKNTFAGLVVPFVLGSPYAVFLLRQNFRSMPRELLDAATLDGAGVLRRLWSVVLPMNRPIVVTLLLITVVTQWNSFLWPSIIAPRPEWHVLTTATSAMQTQYDDRIVLVMAAAVVAMTPLIVLFLIFQRHITRAIGVGAVR